MESTREATTSPTPLRLSSTQKSYREDPDLFRSRLYARAESLFESGYNVYPGSVAHEFVVAYTDAKTGLVTDYQVHLTDYTCTCPFYMRQVGGERLDEDENEPLVPCKHLIGLPSLVRMVRRTLMHDGHIHAACALFKHWMIYQTYKRKLRQHAERESARREKKQNQERYFGKEMSYASHAA